ncbi:hypothetical protein EYV94_19040 [Puteibacter caeruleilacunae]|nr:hypothetical protein EYV94_19040 [Puteibacter caeruleilacunae]
MIDFSGKYTANVDDKGRVIIPSVLKKEMGDEMLRPLFVEMDPYEKCLNIYPMMYWVQRIERIKSALNLDDPVQSRLLDKFYQKFIKVTMTDKGRINIPNSLLNDVQVKKEVVFTGQGNRIRLWDAAVFEESLLTDEEYKRLFEKHLGGSLNPNV